MPHLQGDGACEEEMTQTSELEHLIYEHVNGRKAGRNRKILHLYYIDGYTYEEVAEIVDMSAVQVGRIIRRYGDRILLMRK